jgi:alpha-1,3-mannosyltransferase
MKILYLTGIYYPYEGGVQKVIYDLSNYMKEMNAEVTIITGDDNIICRRSEIINNISVVRLPILSNQFGLSVLRHKADKKIIYQYICNADVVHNHSIMFIPFLIKLSYKTTNTKYFLTSHGFIFHTKKYFIIKKMFMFCFFLILNSYIKIFCSSNQDLRTAKKYKLTNAIYLGTGVDLERFKSVSNINEIIKNQLFYYGRLAPNKGIENALRHFATLPSEFKFIIAGSGEKLYETLISSLCNKLQIADRVYFIGSVSERNLLEQLQLCEFVLLPSLYEGFGITLIESLAANKKIIAHTNESYMDVLCDLNLEKYLFDFTDSNQSLLKKISCLREYPLKNINLEKYSLSSIAEKTYSWYTGLA